VVSSGGSEINDPGENYGLTGLSYLAMKCFLYKAPGPGRDGRVVEGGGLENRFPETGRGFESYSLRHTPS
jgi:hypothetical protein